jgi:glycosyltransferase involved in cell wall biosynthesis
VTVPTDLEVGVPDDYYITAARLVPLKRVEVLIEAFNRLRRRLLIVGDGPEMSRLRGLAGPTVRFLGWRPKDETLRLVASSRAFVTSSIEAFGLAAAEAQCLGVPVVGPEAGGLTEIVVPGQTGVLFSPVGVPALIDAINALDALESRLDRRAIAAASSRLGVATFVSEIRSVVQSNLAGAQARGGPHGRST